MKKLTTLIFALLLVHSVPVWAEAEVFQDEPENSRLSLGAALVVTPEFEGAKKYQLLALPVIEYERGSFFLSAFRGAGFKVINDRSIQMGPVVSYRFGRDQDDSDDLKGLGDVRGGFETGVFAHWRISDPVALKLEFKHGLGTAKGYTVDLGLDYTAELTESLTLILGAETRFADRKYNEEYFGVTRQQSLQSGYRQYSPDSGLKHAAAKASFNYALTDTLNLGVFGEYKRLTGPAADSPLVKKGSANQATSGLALTWNY